MGDEAGNTGIIRNAGATGATIEAIKANIISGQTTGFFLDGADGSLTSNVGTIGG